MQLGQGVQTRVGVCGEVSVDGCVNGIADAVVWGSHGEGEGTLAGELDGAHPCPQAPRPSTLQTPSIVNAL